MDSIGAVVTLRAVPDCVLRLVGMASSGSGNVARTWEVREDTERDAFGRRIILAMGAEAKSTNELADATSGAICVLVT